MISDYDVYSVSRVPLTGYMKLYRGKYVCYCKLQILACCHQDYFHHGGGSHSLCISAMHTRCVVLREAIANLCYCRRMDRSFACVIIPTLVFFHDHTAYLIGTGTASSTT